MTAKELREKYIHFFKSKGHELIPSASLIPENDTSVLFTSAGMQQLVRYFLGELHPAGKRLVNYQRCLRTDDIDLIGDETHHSFFEMLGNWSLGDYFKKESILWSFEFLVSKEYLNLEKSKLAVSVFAGDENSPFDAESYQTWLELGFSEERIAKLGKKDNWWGPVSASGPCGPDTEIFYWTGKEAAPKEFDPENPLWVEIWNNVFMEYFKEADGSYSLLKQKNVDTGMGLERISAILGPGDNYMTDLFLPLIKKIEDFSALNYQDSVKIKKSMRIIADHIKAFSFIVGDKQEIVPSNLGQGYIARRLLRRAIMQARSLDIDLENARFLEELIDILVELYQEYYPELLANKARIKKEAIEELNKFKLSLEQGLKEFKKIMLEKKKLDASDAFLLYQSYGFPFEISQDLAREEGLELDESEFQKEFKKHQDLSRTAAVGEFKGGLSDGSKETLSLHTAAHLLLAAMQKVLGPETEQKGSNINSERLRYDFNYPRKLSAEEISEIENIVNQAIQEAYDVAYEEMSKEEADSLGAIGTFPDHYGKQVRVYTIGRNNGDLSSKWTEVFSRELCGGPHVESLKGLGTFKIKKEESSSAGVRRIKAVLLKNN